MISKAREDFRFLRCILDEIMEKIKSEVRFNMHKIYFHSEIKCFNHLINVEQDLRWNNSLFILVLKVSRNAFVRHTFQECFYNLYNVMLTKKHCLRIEREKTKKIICCGSRLYHT